MTTEQDESRVEDGGNRTGGYLGEVIPKATAQYPGLPDGFIPPGGFKPESFLLSEVDKARNKLRKQTFPTGEKIMDWESNAKCFAENLHMWAKRGAMPNISWWKRNLKDIANLIAVGYDANSVKIATFGIREEFIISLLRDTSNI